MAAAPAGAAGSRLVSGEPALALEAVRAKLGGREVLCGVSLELRSGEVLGLAGANGAGKTTLLRAASGVLRPDAGRVLLAGRPLGSYGRRELARQIAVVPQDTPFAFPFRAGEAVLMGRSPHLPRLGFEGPRDLAIARSSLAQVGIEALADRSILELSGGERQLVLLARALAQQPNVLLLDEPTAHLDLRHRLQVLELVRELAAAGRSALVVSHDLSLAARSCDRLALLAAGRVLAVGPPAEVLSREAVLEVFGIEADVIAGPDGTPLVLPRKAKSKRPVE
jgi:iron complex transport system ATP-binding protein